MSHFAFGASGPGGIPGNDSFTKILLHMDGTSGGTTFTDVNFGGSPATWSTSGSVSTSTTTPKFGTACYLGDANGHIVSNQVGAYAAGSSDFTVDFWMRGSSSNSTTLQYIAGFIDSGQSTFTAGWQIYYDASKFIRASFGNTSFQSYQPNTGATTVMDNSWHHIAYVKTSTTSKIYIDGVFTGSAVTPSGSMYSSTSQRMWVGSSPGALSNQSFRGQLDEFRYSVGIARWTSNFTPPTGPYV